MIVHILSIFLFIAGIAAGIFNNVLGISLPICAVLLIIGDSITSIIKSRLDDLVDAKYAEIHKKIDEN